MSNRDPVEPAKMLIRYVLALSLLVVFVIGGHGLHVVTGKQGALDEEIINASGRQRMLSQRIVLLSHRYNAEFGNGQYADLLRDSLAAFETSHEWLLTKAVVSGGAVQAHYRDPMGERLDARSRMFAELANSLLTEAPGSDAALRIADQIEAVALTDLLSALNVAVTLFENAANERARMLERIQILVVVATLLILLLEILLIFYPAHKSMVGMIERLRFQAWHDQMTGLANRARFLTYAAKMMNDTPSKLDRMFVLALDLDGFKEVNDTLGHPVGDQVLRHVSRILEKVVRSEGRLGDSVIARVGGDEFLICGYVPEGDVTDCAELLGAQILTEIEKPVPIELENRRKDSCVIGVSIGYTLGEESHGNIDLFLGNADIALYESKKRGKGVSTGFEGSMRAVAEHRHRLSNELKLGLRGLQFRAFFQPQIDLSTGHFYGVEALARWDHPDRGLIGPSEFVEMAEESRIIDVLDGQIMLAALDAYRQSALADLSLGKLSLNASGLALRDGGFCDLLYNIAKAHGMTPDQITIEVLENVLMRDDADPAVETIRKLSRAGFDIAVDDFGVGYSSLSRLSRKEISAIKMDRSLIDQMGTGNMDKILVAIAAMARGIEATLLAEGIEDADQLAVLQHLGVDIGQGYFWSEPLSLDDLQNWIRTRNQGNVAMVYSAG